MQINLLVEAGDMKPGPTLSQKLGPAGIPVGQVIQKVNDATKQFKGLKVPVELEIDSNKNIIVVVLSPPVSELLKKELGLDKGSNFQKKTKVANASIEQIISVSKTKYPNLLSKNMKAAVKTVVGTCLSLGVLIENMTPQEIEVEIEAGKYDEEISQEKTETSEEKRKKLDEFFLNVKSEQEKIQKIEEAAKAAAAEESGKKPEEAKTTEETKTPEKKEEKKQEKK